MSTSYELLTHPICWENNASDVSLLVIVLNYCVTFYSQHFCSSLLSFHYDFVLPFISETKPLCKAASYQNCTTQRPKWSLWRQILWPNPDDEAIAHKAAEKKMDLDCKPPAKDIFNQKSDYTIDLEYDERIQVNTDEQDAFL